MDGTDEDTTQSNVEPHIGALVADSIAGPSDPGVAISVIPSC
jgi:hypothetical protein